MPISVTEQLEERWIFSRVEDLAGGLNVRTPTQRLKDSESPDVCNVQFHKGRIETAHGCERVDYEFLGDRPIPILFPRIDGTTDQLTLTNKTLYIRNIADWKLASRADPGDLEGEHALGATAIEISTAMSDLSVGDPVQIGEHVTTIATVTDDTNFVLMDGLEEAAASGTEVRFGVALNGSDTFYPDWDIMPSADMIVITNGVDTPIRYTTTLGANAQPVEKVPGLEAAFTTFSARSVIVWKNLLIFLDTTEDGERYPFRVRRSNVASPGNWTSGLAGRTDLLDSASPILGARRLGPYLIIYRSDSIIRGEWIGSAFILIDFNTVIEGPGPISKTSIISLDSYHIYTSSYGIHLYRGLLETDDIGSKVDLAIFPPDGALSEDVFQEILLCRVEETRTVYILIPDTDENGNEITTAYGVYIPQSQDDLVIPYWTCRQFPFRTKAVGRIIENRTGASWATQEGHWDSYTTSWGGGSLTGTVREATLTDDQHNVHRFGPGYALDGSDQITWRYRSRLFSLDDRDIRTDAFAICYQGDGFDLKYRLDTIDDFVLPTDKDGNEVRMPDNPSGRCFTVWGFQQNVCRDLELLFEGQGQTQIIWYGFRVKQEDLPGLPMQGM